MALTFSYDEALKLVIHYYPDMTKPQQKRVAKRMEKTGACLFHAVSVVMAYPDCPCWECHKERYHA